MPAVRAAADCASGRAAWGLLVALALTAPSAYAEDEPKPAPLVPANATPVAPATPAETTAEAGASAAELAVARAARPSVARVRLRDPRFGDRTMTRHAVVVRRDGLFLMAGPPPGRAGTITLVLHDGRQLRARQLGHDAETALTLLRVATTNLPALRGAAGTPQAAGSTKTPRAPAAKPAPLGLPALGSRLVMVTGDDAVAVGPVRAHGRIGSLRDPDRRIVIRTTGLVGVALAAVDTDAGAPLLDGAGRLAGLLVGRRATIAPAPGERPAAQGLKVRPRPVEAVIVPAEVVRLIWPLLEEHGRVPRAGLGIKTQALDESLRAHLGLKSGGHVIRSLEPGGAAARQGLRRHDVIVSVGGRKAPPGTSLHDLLLPFRPRETVALGVTRGGASKQVSVVLGERSRR